MNNVSVANNLRSKCTPSGRSVSEWVDEPRDENYVYRTIEDLFERIYGPGFEFSHDSAEHKKDEQIERVIAALRISINNSVENERLGMFGRNGQQLFVNPQRSFSYLVSKIEDLDGGFSEFLGIYDLPQDVALKLVIACAAMLDLDDALGLVESGDICRAVWIIYGVTEATSEIFEMWDEEYRKEKQSKIASERGRAAHKETNEYKEKVIEAWSQGRFNTIAACARWALKTFPIVSDETPKRWVREYKEGLLSKA